jgi:hypothetical protein
MTIQQNLLGSTANISLNQITNATVPPTPPIGRAYDSFTGRSVDVAFDYYVPGEGSEMSNQWHLRRLGNIASVWQEYTGRGVAVGVYDSGVQSSHWDLSPNYDASKHVVIGGTPLIGEENGDSGPHGTSVAGLIAGARNGRGGVGVSYGAAVTGVNIFDPTSPIFVNGDDATSFFDAMLQASRFDVVNHSWGDATPHIMTSRSRGEQGTYNYSLTQTVAYAAEVGRGGLGTVTVSSAGNSSVDGQSDAWKTDRHSVAVAAYRQADGVAAVYSTHGAHILVSASSSDFPEFNGSGLVTTDMLGTAGYNASFDPAAAADYTDQFGGTSGAAPIVTGVVALVLDANENLGWRDVRNILAASSKMPVAFETGPVLYTLALSSLTRTFSLSEGSFQVTGDSAKWNGGGMHYSQDYGYGAVDAYSAVRMAEVWSLFDAPKTSANEATISTGVISAGVTVEGGTYDIDTLYQRDFATAPGVFTFEVAESIDVEHIDLSINFQQRLESVLGGRDLEDQFASLTNTQFKLTAPDGTEAFVSTTSSAIVSEANQEFTFGFAGFRGVDTKGIWTIEFASLDTEGVSGGFRYSTNPVTTLNSIKMDVTGSTASSNDVHIYTDEFIKMTEIAGEGDRRVLTDSNGGEDWINMAAITRSVEVSLVEGAVSTFGARVAFTGTDPIFSIGQGSRIENLVTGEGRDVLTGNALDNKLYGMRGSDWLNGGAGNDTLSGGRGLNVFAFDTAGNSGKDKIVDMGFGQTILTTKQLRGADENGLITVGANALVLLDNSTRGDTVELVGQAGAILMASGRSELIDYWIYQYVGQREPGFEDGRVSEMAVGQTGQGSLAISPPEAGVEPTGLSSFDSTHEAAFYLYDAMGDGMSSGVQTFA